MPTTNAPLDLNRVDLNLLVAFDALMAERKRDRGRCPSDSRP